MKYGLIVMGILFCCLPLCGQRSALPNPDRYPADSIIVMLREDTAANQFKAWAINRTDSTIILEAVNGVAENWLEVKDDEENWRVYNSDSWSTDYNTWIRYVLPLRRNDFAKVSMKRTPGTFQTLARARFTLGRMAYYSSTITVSIDTIGFLPSDLRHFTYALHRTHKDSSKRRSRLQYSLGAMLMRKERYGEALEKCAKALELDSTNYQAIIAQGDLKIRQASKAKLEETEISKIIKAVFASFEVIPITEKELQEKIELRRKGYARWLED